MVNIYEYHVGDKVRVLSYDEFVQHYPLDRGIEDRFNCMNLCFTPEMKQFCGEVFEIEWIDKTAKGWSITKTTASLRCTFPESPNVSTA